MAAALAAAAPLLAQRPNQYPPKWQQFDVEQFNDPRRVCITRLGAGPSRPAEVLILEMMPEGRSLRRLFHRALITEMTWWLQYSVSGGRFLVTMDDRFLASTLEEQPRGSTPNAIVIYDLLRETHASFRVEQFLPAIPAMVRSTATYGPGHWLDPRMDRLHIGDPALSRELSIPYLVIDLPGLEVRTQLPPTPEAEQRLKADFLDTDASRPLLWDWSSGAGAEPDWGAALQVPQYLRARTRGPDDDIGPLGIEQRVLHFRLDPASGDYVRCPEDQWVESPIPETPPPKKSNTPVGGDKKDKRGG